MQELFVYRVQDKEGRGPWRPGFSQIWVETRLDHMFLPPWYVEFGRVDLNCGDARMHMEAPA